MVMGVFIDGPLAGEVRSVHPSVRVLGWNEPIPARATFCDCNPNDEILTSEVDSRIERYYPIATGEKVVILSIRNEEEGILKGLKEWVQTDLSAGPLTNHCRSRRAFR